jgi:integrase/recombinase XerD
MRPTKTNDLTRFTKLHGNALTKVQQSDAWDKMSRQLQRSSERFGHQSESLVHPHRDRAENAVQLLEETPQPLVALAEDEEESAPSERQRTITDEGVTQAGSIEQLVEEYLFHLGDQRCTVATLRWHRYHLSRFSTWALAHGATAYPADWERNDQDRLLVRRYLSEVGRQPTTRGRQRSAASLKSVQSSLRSFCRWLHVTGRLQTDLLAGASSPRLSQPLKETFPADKIERLLVAAAAYSRNPLRDAALVRFMLDTGCRAAEVCGLLAADIDWTERQAKVLGKGRKERFVFFSRGVAEAMRRYWTEERSDRTPYFFESEASTNGTPLTPSGLLSVCKRLGEHAGVRANPHKFRHTFAIAYLRAGGDVFALQKRLGHSQLAMSEHYAKHLTEDLRREHDEHSPDQFFFGQESN